LKVLRLTATTPDGPLTLDLPVAGRPGIKEFEQTIKEGNQRDQRTRAGYRTE
jgi:hypothetical protein